MTLSMTGVHENLALEGLLAARIQGGERILFLWRNNPCVVIGRNQNPYAECDLSAMAQGGVTLARRPSGGGAVYHDHGTLNVSLITPRQDEAACDLIGLLVAVLRDFGLDAEASGRNDVVVHSADGTSKKCAGSAYFRTSTAYCHHVCILLNTDLARLQQVLHPPDVKLRTKGVASVKARVGNLGLDMDALCRAIEQKAAILYGAKIPADVASGAHAEPGVPTEPGVHDIHTAVSARGKPGTPSKHNAYAEPGTPIERTPQYRTLLERFRSDAWLFGRFEEQPLQQFRFNWGTLGIVMETRGDTLWRIQLATDAMEQEGWAKLQHDLTGASKTEAENIVAASGIAKETRPDVAAQIKSLWDFVG